MNVSSNIVAPRQPAVTPRAPTRISETGLPQSFLLDLLIKSIFRNGMERPSRMARELCVSIPIIEALIEDAKDKELVFLLGQPGANMTAEMRYQLTDKGREWARRALELNNWTGAAPVPIEAFFKQMMAQSVRKEKLRESRLREVFSELTLSEALMQVIGPAVNSGRSMLLYGPPGNGKSSIVAAVCLGYESLVYVPHALAVGSEIVLFYDPAIHRPIREQDMQGGVTLRRMAAYDPRYVPCMRPYMITGGELTLDKLELTRNPTTKLYEAPLQFKASGGLFVVDDFGRQQHTPQELINRLIIPLEAGIDHLIMESGRKIEVPFDCLVMFATNYEPRSLMDEAGLRRMHHKILVDRPDRKNFVRILLRAASGAGIKIDENTLAYLLFELYGKHPSAKFNAFHPRFLIDQCTSICSFRGMDAQITPEILDIAWENLMMAH